MSASGSVNINELIDRCPLGWFQIRVIVLCGFVALLEGFDIQAIGVAAPAMAGPLHIEANQLGFLFSTALFGLMLGGFVLGPVADRYGRKHVLIICTAALGVFTLCTANATTLQQLLLFRFLTGLGLGGAMPSCISLAMEYTPRSKRQKIVGLLYTGLPLGGVIAGLLASRLIATVGWPSLFYIGGILPLGLSVVLIRAMPDSIEFLVLCGGAEREIRDLLIRISSTLTIPSGCQFVMNEKETNGAPVRQLFLVGKARITILLWISYFTTFMMLGTSAAWTPTLLEKAGINGVQSSVAIALFSLGYAVGTPLAGFLGSRFGSLLPAALLGSAVALATAGRESQSVPLVIAFLGFAGFFLGIAMSGLIALASLLYPTAIRSTGVGWVMGIGRLGALVGPLAIGLFLERSSQVGNSFVALSVPALFAALFTGLIGINRSSSAADPG